MKALVTGGAGFIGSAVVGMLVSEFGVGVVTVDALTYAGNLANLATVADKPNHRFVHADIRDGKAMADLFQAEQPDAVMHLAAEKPCRSYPSGVDRLPGRVSFGEADRLIGVDGGGSVHEFIYGQKLYRAAAEPFLA